jgi:hypothetical protein
LRANDEFQLYNMRASLARAGIDPEKFDTHAHLDRTLTMSENRKNLEKMTGAGSHRHVTRHLQKEKDRHGGKLPKYRGFFDQVGKSHTEIDRKIKAKPPGDRTSRSGRKYTERRKNRSDRPGLWI